MTLPKELNDDQDRFVQVEEHIREVTRHARAVSYDLTELSRDLAETRIAAKAVMDERDYLHARVEELLSSTPSPTPDPAPMPDPTPAPAPADPFDGGRFYPLEPLVIWNDAIVAPGARVAHVHLTLSKPAIHTVIAHPKSRDGQNSPNYGRVNGPVSPAIRFMPGETRKSFAVPVHPMKEGQFVEAVQESVPDLGVDTKKLERAFIRCSADEPPTQPIDDDADAMKPSTFVPHGAIFYDKAGAEIVFTDDGAGATFATQLPHGRTQEGNQETGYYAPMSFNNFEIVGDDLLLKTRKLDQVHVEGTYACFHVAAALSGHKATETHLKYGTFEFEAKMPSRAGTWPALWFLDPKGWPPEIDLYEGFYHTANKADQLSCGMHGGKVGDWQSGRDFVRWAGRHTMRDMGLEPTLTTEFHKYACTITPEWIIMFMDGVETIRMANPFVGRTWFPIFNVAVKHGRDAAYDQGTAHMAMRRLRIWKAE